MQLLTSFNFSWKEKKKRCHSRGHYLRKFIGTKESVYRRKELNYQRIGLGHRHERRLIAYQYGLRDVMRKHSIACLGEGSIRKETGHCVVLLIDWKFASSNQTHYSYLASDASSVWNFCARFPDVTSRRNQWWRRKMSAVFSGYSWSGHLFLGWVGSTVF